MHSSGFTTVSLAGWRQLLMADARLALGVRLTCVQPSVDTPTCELREGGKQTRCNPREFGIGELVRCVAGLVIVSIAVECRIREERCSADCWAPMIPMIGSIKTQPKNRPRSNPMIASIETTASAATCTKAAHMLWFCVAADASWRRNVHGQRNPFLGRRPLRDPYRCGALLHAHEHHNCRVGDAQFRGQRAAYWKDRARSLFAPVATMRSPSQICRREATKSETAN
jgi:hypothetical protein